MSGLNHFFRFIVYSNIFIGLCAASLAAETFVLLSLPASLYWYLPLLFCCTLFVYSLHYFAKLRKGRADSRLQWCQQHSYVLPASIFFSGAIIAWLAFAHRQEIFYSNGSFNYSNLVWFITIPLLALSYSHPLNPVSRKSLRNTGWLKMALLSFTWSFTTTVLPLLMLAPHQAVSPYELTVLFIHRFFFIAALSVLFNSNDYEEDKADGVKTIAVLLGPARTLQKGKWLTLLLNSITAAWLLQAFQLQYPLFYAALAIPVLLVFAAYHRFRKAGAEVFFVLRHDGLMIVQALLLIFALLIQHHK